VFLWLTVNSECFVSSSLYDVYVLFFGSIIFCASALDITVSAYI